MATNEVYWKTSTNLKYFDPIIWTQPSRETVNKTATDPKLTQLTVAAANAPIPILYGLVRVGPKIAYVVPYQGKLVILAIWGHGPIDSIQQMWIDDKDTPAGITYVHRLGGTDNNTIPTELTAAIPGYADILPGICYSVITVTAGSSTNFPRVNALIKGLKVYDPRTTTTVWSDNPALCTADFITNSTYGMGLEVDWDSVSTVATFNDTPIGSPSEKSRTLNISMESPQLCESWLETLRTYTSCWLIRSGDTIKFIADTTGSSVYTFDHDDNPPSIHSISNIIKRGLLNTPNVMILNYTSTLSLPYKSDDVTIDISGTAGRKESSISLPGINRYSQAYREAMERINKLTANDLSFDLDIFDIGVKLEIGDIVSVKHPIGIADQYGNAKLMRIMGISTNSTARYKLSLVEYDPAVYYNTVHSAPTWSDTNFRDPVTPPSVTSLLCTEEVFQLDNGTYSSRIKSEWVGDTNYPYLANYLIEVYQGTDIISSFTTRELIHRSSAMQEGLEYIVKVYGISSMGSVSTVTQANVIVQGKYLVPGNVPSISAFEVGGRVYISWEPAVDIDIWRYEVRYGSSTWEAAKLIDRVDALRLQADQIPTGTHTLFVKALDSVGQYSTTAATIPITVTSDASSFLVDTKNHSVPVLTNMQEYSIGRLDSIKYYVTEDNVMFGTKFATTVDQNDGTKVVLADSHSALTSIWEGDGLDFGLDLGGSWQGTATVSDISGTHTSFLGYTTSNTYPTYTYIAGLSQKFNARWVKLKHVTNTTSSTLKVELPEQSIRLDALPREETGRDFSTGSSTPKTIYLENSYVDTKQIQITPISVSAYTHTVDNIGNNLPNAADKHANITIASDEKTLSIVATANALARSKHPIPTTGKYYWEVLVNTQGGSGSAFVIGVMQKASLLTNVLGYYPRDHGYLADGTFKTNNATDSSPSTYTSGDVIGISYNNTDNELLFYKNGAAQATITLTSGYVRYPAIQLFTAGDSLTYRVSEGEFTQTVPTGFSPLPYAFDVYIFDSSTGLSAPSTEFLWAYQGV